jgi:serine O-acetyltransferase
MPWFRRRRDLRPPLTAEQRAYFESDEGKAFLRAHFATPEGAAELRRSLEQEILDRQPTLGRAVWEDARIYSSLRMQPPTFDDLPGFVRESLRMAWNSDAFLPMVLYRLRVELTVRDVPIVPTLLHRSCMALAQIDIGKGVVLDPGVYLPHGQVVIDGRVVIGSGTVISPWVTLGRNGPALEGPTLGAQVFVGTGAKILGPVTIGDGARIAANAVVLSDVPAYATAAGAPARIVRRRSHADGEKGARADE